MSINIKALGLPVLVMLTACMQAEKISLDTSGLQGLLLGSVSFNANATAGGGNGGTTPPPAPTPPTVLATTPGNGMEQSPLHLANGVLLSMSETLDPAAIPTVTFSILRSGQEYPLTNLNLTTTISGSGVYINPHWSIWPERVKFRVTVDLSMIRDTQGESGSGTQIIEFQTAPLKAFLHPVPEKNRVYTPYAVGSDEYFRQVDGGFDWMPCVQGLTGATCSSGTVARYTYEQAQQACGSLNAGSGYAGRTNWRTPTVLELESLVDYGKFAPAIAASFPGTPSELHWTSNSLGVDGTTAWAVDFSTGEVRRVSKTSTYPVRCISATSSLSVDADGAWNVQAYFGSAYAHFQGGMLWPEYDICPVGHTYLFPANCTAGSDQFALISVMTACSNRGSRVRLTGISEIRYLLRRNREAEIPNFKPASSPVYWTATPYAGNTSKAFTVNFVTGEVILATNSDLHGARCLLDAP